MRKKKEPAAIPTTPFTSGSSVAAKIMVEYGFKEGQGLGKKEQGMSRALQERILGTAKKDFFKVRKASSIKEGDIVLVGDTNSKRINWPLGKVKNIYPGKDGIVRVVEIKTKNGTFLRPVQRLYPLEVGEPGNFPFPGEEPTPSVADGHFTREPPSVPDPVSTKTDHQDPLVRRSRYSQILKPTKT
ncbi:uncharacterized protein TNIN_221881 [Trichonephila inaurata madagascariensis]|uniref:G-patch domain-containing protein n=1 Tax=Trichonephila inaurata madagascariensis TaxID=2747483 RepID=A0A8X6YGH5_9ARAC|nr:uncharacterized protein TNIN_221881 [Trichonephila inaurata madagascariensis]